MKKPYKLILVVGLIILAYFLGNWIPISLLVPDFTEDKISSLEHYKLVISIVSASITFLAVFVALFKDDLREYWKYSRAEFSFPDNLTIEITSTQESSNDSLIASKYISRIQVHNSGNLPLLNTEICLDRLEYFAQNSNKGQFIEVNGKSLKWNGTEETSISIPAGRKKLVDVLELIAPQKFSTPDTTKPSTSIPAKLVIGSHSPEENRGKWIATFSLCAQNHKEVNFAISIVWNGSWKTRLTDMSTTYIIEKHS